MTERVLLAPQTATGNSLPFKVLPGRPRRIYCYPVATLAASQVVGTLAAEDPAANFGAQSDHLFTGGANTVQLSDTVTSFVVTAEGNYRINKAATTGAVGIGISDTLGEGG